MESRKRTSEGDRNRKQKQHSRTAPEVGDDDDQIDESMQFEDPYGDEV
jgi:hypothetical protein